MPPGMLNDIVDRQERVATYQSMIPIIYREPIGYSKS
ncbi:MAG: hypothetical protein JWQ98_2716 [Chlorobi bacterium]|nr:hypothetical protein [Chlorobiota bacterium]